LLAIFILQL